MSRRPGEPCHAKAKVFSALMRVAEGQARSGDAAGAFRTLAEYRDNDHVREAIQTVSKSAAKHPQSLDVPAVRREVESIRDHLFSTDPEGVRDRLLGTDAVWAGVVEELASAQAAAGDIHGALDAARSISKSEAYTQAIPLGRIAAARWLRGDRTGAERILAQTELGDIRARACQSFAEWLLDPPATLVKPAPGPPSSPAPAP